MHFGLSDALNKAVLSAAILTGLGAKTAPAAAPELPVIPEAHVHDGEGGDQTPVTWDTVLKDYGTEYDYGTKIPSYPNGNPTIAVQFESLYPILQGMMIHEEGKPLLLSTERHGHSAAKIIDQFGSMFGEREIETHFIYTPMNSLRVPDDFQNPVTQTVFQYMDVGCISMAKSDGGNQFDVTSAGEIDTPEEIKAADQFALNSSTVFVCAAGNSGHDRAIDLVRADADHFIRADTLLRVGEARLYTNDQYIVPHSSASGVSLVTINPYFHGFSYPYIKDAQSARADIIKFFNAPAAGRPDMSAKRFFIETLIERCGGPMEDPEYPPIAWKKGDPFQSCHPQFHRASFPGKELLMAPKSVRLQQPERVWKAFVNGLVDAVDYQKNQYPHKQGNTYNLPGTSFSAPYAAALIAGAHARYPDLHDMDLVFAALIAAEPVKKVQGRGNIKYIDNGRGLPFNSYNGGFGLFVKEPYKDILNEMSSLLSANPQLKTSAQMVSSDMVSYDQSSLPTIRSGVDLKGRHMSFRDYSLRVHEDIVALRANLAIDVAGAAKNIPVKIMLISPKGGYFDISPTKLEDMDDKKMEFSLASTDGVAGSYTEGVWTVRVPANIKSENIKLERAQLTVHGTQKEGLVDHYLGIKEGATMALNMDVNEQQQHAPR